MNTIKEEFATTIVAKLQSFIQEVNISLEKTAEQVNQNIPRIAREIEVMQNEAKLLQHQMNSVKGDVMKVEHDASQAMQTLLKIDHVKSCMQEASKALREADNWTTLSADVEEIFDSGDINAIAMKLVGMQNSLEILADVPDYQERCFRLENLKDRLEAMISPRLIAAFNTQSLVTDVALMYMKIFKDLRRLSTLQKHYHNFQKNQLIQQWKQIVECDPEETLIDWLNNFHDILLSTWHSQMTCCQQLLPDSSVIQVLSELLVDVLTNLDPSLAFCIDAGMKLQSNRLQYLIELKQITDRLAKSLEISIHSVEPKELNSAHVILLVKTIYAPYRPHIEKYDSLEEQHLVASLKTLSMSEDIIDCARLLGDSVSKVFCFIQEAESRCQQLTQGCGYIGLLRALEGFLVEYSGNFRCLLRLFRNKMQFKDENQIDDWSLFQQSLQATQIIGEVLMQLENLVILYTENIREVGRKLGYYSPTEEHYVNAFHTYDDVLLCPGAKREFQQLITKLQEEQNVHLLPNSTAAFKKLCSDAGYLVSDLVLKQAQVHLQKVPQMKLWAEDISGSVIADLPQFSLSPQEYITEVGQYLMTIPQHIEPFILRDNPALHTALKNCNMPHSVEQDSSSNVADYLLECLARRITDCYCENILRISYITANAINQLITDIGYFCDVLDDLGLFPSADLQHLLSLLKAKPETFETESKGKPQVLVRKIQTMRKLRT
ncbi:conserved oligomeric Golgi complex subunit 7-like isoform X2 [Stegodyphus dumicola]|uniref:conserved oligomeric Golgi complex subunit 7-like isoform X2 n=1 Tax=Stegodyphus dumicola TaxID=202533 RepID=UPI0015AE790C|nr:conserved oligomeric Golgi complex subunit 7-like isoform X2 [Stegodyphus dumicola]